MEDALKQGPVLVAMHPMLVCIRLQLSKLEAGVGVKGKPEPILPFDYKITDEQPFGSTCQVQDSDYIVHFTSADWTDRA